jgi:hypothetical protein
MNSFFIEGSYPDLTKYGTKPGVYRSPAGYQHPWLAVTPYGTAGAWSRAEARAIFRAAKREAEILEYLERLEQERGNG